MSMYWLIPIGLMFVLCMGCIMDLYTRVDALEKEVFELRKPNIQL